jgi:uncharacterized protein YjbI with pentapeptide repeats
MRLHCLDDAEIVATVRRRRTKPPIVRTVTPATAASSGALNPAALLAIGLVLVLVAAGVVAHVSGWLAARALLACATSLAATFYVVMAMRQAAGPDAADARGQLTFERPRWLDSKRTLTGGAAAPEHRMQEAGTPPRHDLAGINATGARLIGVDLTRADLANARLDRAHLSEARLDEAMLRGARLDRSVLRNASLTSADLSHARLDRADLTGARLAGANLSDANRRRANLRDSNLVRADLRGADLREAELRGARFENARLDYADLRGAQFLRSDLPDLTNVRCDDAAG